MYTANPFSHPDQRKGQPFVASFSGGKDSMLAIFRCVEAGMLPLEMLTTCPESASQSWFHKVDKQVLFSISRSVNIPLTLIETSGEEYSENFEKALCAAKERGAKYAVFGDIDIEGHLAWCTERCLAVGLIPYFPLWQENREALVREFVDKGFQGKIIVTIHEQLKVGFLGRYLTHALLDEMKGLGIDVCGENGEYHTVVLDGPLFSEPVSCPSA